MFFRAFFIAGLHLLLLLKSPAIQAVDWTSLFKACGGGERAPSPVSLNTAIEKARFAHHDPIEIWTQFMSALDNSRGERNLAAPQLKIFSQFLLQNAVALAKHFDAEKNSDDRSVQIMGVTLSKSIYRFWQWAYFLKGDEATTTEIKKLKESWLSILMWHSEVPANYWSSDYSMELQQTFPISLANPNITLRGPREKSDGHFAFGFREVAALIQRMGPYLQVDVYIFVIQHMSRIHSQPMEDIEMTRILNQIRDSFGSRSQVETILSLLLR